jgi:hypothetical protein
MKKPLVPWLIARWSLKTRTPVTTSPSPSIPILSAPRPFAENWDPTTSLMTASAPGASVKPFVAEGAELPPAPLGKNSSWTCSGLEFLLTIRRSATNFVLFNPSTLPTTGKYTAEE